MWYNELKNRVNSLNDLITEKKESVDEYTKIRSNIDTLKNYQSNLNNGSCELVRAVNYFSTKPELVFDTEEEYGNYQSYDDNFIKTELVQSKLLEKKKK